MLLSNSFDNINSKGRKRSKSVSVSHNSDNLKLKELESKKEDIKKESAKLNEKVLEQKDKQENLKENISDLENEVNSLGNSILQMQREIYDNERKIKQLNNEIESRKVSLEEKKKLCRKCFRLMHESGIFDAEVILKAKEYRDLQYRLGASKIVWVCFWKICKDMNNEMSKIFEYIKQVEQVKEKNQKEVKEIKEKRDLMKNKIKVLGEDYDNSKKIENSAMMEIDENSEEMKKIDEQASKIRKEIEERRRREEEERKRRELELKKKEQLEKKSKSDKRKSKRRSKSETKKGKDSVNESVDVKPRSKSAGSSEGLLWPVPGFRRVTGRFGEWRGNHHHGGIDIGRKEDGTPIFRQRVFSPWDGIVTFASYGSNGNYGNHVRVEINFNGRTYQLRYGHLDDIGKGVFAGGRISRGAVIGYVGGSGNNGKFTFPPHLHFEILELKGGSFVKIDPLSLNYV